ncbi:MAG TPA: winged helix-turn-helix domain-containing protein, partial [Vicinamibacterales bacterium]|nr:winged helix-turn-helix domain-containing protein [Vicinamibacterales bacterium]
MPPAPGRIFEFGRFRLDTTQGVLLRDGERVALIPKAVDLLAVLVAAPGRVVTKEQLLEAVWPDAFVQEGNLSKLVFLLRRELEAAADSGEIETVSKRGYAFKGAVREVSEPVAAVAAAPDAIGVLPFTTSGDAAPHLGESVAEEVIVALSRYRDIAVVARTSSFRFGAAGVDLADVGRRLRVTAIVEGSVRAEGPRMRVTAGLVDTGTSFQRWSRTFECDRSELAALPAAIAAALFEAMVPAAAPPSPLPARRASPEAYDLYLQGRYFWNRRPGDATWRALECFEKAARLDPDFAEAWAGIADVYSTLGSWEAGVLPHDEAQQKARAF